MIVSRWINRIVFSGLLALANPATTAPLGSAFTYQGDLRDGGTAVTGLYDLELRLFDAPTNGVEVAPFVSAPAVPVADGRFTVAPDFGASVFNGNERWLQLAVRPAGNGAYTILLPRQLLRVAPEAQHANVSAIAPWAGLTGVPGGFADGVDNNSGGTVTSVGAGTGLSGGPITSAGTLSIDPTAVQLRVTGSCPGGQSVASINQNGSVNCIAGGTGGITQIIAGSGLSGGTITTSGTIAIAKGGIVADMIADNAVGFAQIDKSQVQARINGTCAAGRYFRGVASNGTIVCELLPGVHAITTVDSAPLTGYSPSLRLGSDGLPVIAYRIGDQSPNAALKVVRCNDLACSGGDETITTVDNLVSQTGLIPVLAIGNDGFPVIAYREGNGALRVAKCADVACTGSVTRTTVVPGAVPGVDSLSIAVPVDGNPVIAFRDLTSGGVLRIAKCNDPACAGGNEDVNAIATAGNNVARDAQLVIGSDGFPVIAHEDVSNSNLLVTKCDDAACKGGGEVTVTADSSPNIVGYHAQIAIRANGRPLITSIDATSGTLRVVDCQNLGCSASPVAVVGDNGKAIGAFSQALTLGLDGLPTLVFVNGTDGSLRTARCADDHCFAGTANYATLDDPGADLRGLSAVTAPDGTALVAYHDFTNFRLKVVKCGSRNCQ